jgi:hypothetical protein
MNKFLMLSAAALLGGSVPTLAGDLSKAHTIQFYTGSGNTPYCDGMTFQKAGNHMAVGTHLNDNCSSNIQVAGTVDKAKYTLDENPTVTVAEAFDIYRPIVNGGNWDVWVCYNGTTCFQGNAGIYKKGFSGAARGSVATTARVAEMIAERKAARARLTP